MRSTASVLHVDLDAFFAAVEQRDKPSLRGKPVVVGGTGRRGVVSTASYEARVYGVHSAMPGWQARAQLPGGAAFLSGRFAAYRASSRAALDALREIAPVVEQVSIDEAYADLALGENPWPVETWERADAEAVAARLREAIADATGGLTASVGIGSSKMMAKMASEAAKPDGFRVIWPGQEEELLAGLPVRTLPGVGPATATRLGTFGVRTVQDLRRVTLSDLVSILGEAWGQGVHDLARGIDHRPIVTHREAKSVSAEETFATDLTDVREVEAELRLLADRVSGRLARAGLFGRTVSVKLRRHDFSTHLRSTTLRHGTDDAAVISGAAVRLAGSIGVGDGVRLLGVGVSGFVEHSQEELALEVAEPAGSSAESHTSDEVEAAGEELLDGADAHAARLGRATWPTGADVVHAEHGAGWVWGSGRGVVTVRFEGPRTGPGPVRSFSADDPELQPAEPPEW
ncbi:DNA polymerase IV [Kytococcus sedentarius]|uniref:DNA polymerase IV n=1 Tax=Kytococcus sedentarius TaxID=1276 RepID=UPI0035BC6644